MPRDRTSAEEQILRQLGSRSAREAGKRRLERGVRALGRRLRNAGITFVLLLFLIIVGIATGYLGLITAPLALFAAFIATVLVLFLPSRRRAPPAPQADVAAGAPLHILAAHTEEWLIQRVHLLPSEAGRPLDRIVERLRDLQPVLIGVSPDTVLGGETQRLIGHFLPGLVNTWQGLPPPEREPGADHNRRLADSLDIVANELDSLCDRLGCERVANFEIENRFIESRYKDGEQLSLDKRP